MAEPNEIPSQNRVTEQEPEISQEDLEQVSGGATFVERKAVDK